MPLSSRPRLGTAVFLSALLAACGGGGGSAGTGTATTTATTTTTTVPVSSTTLSGGASITGVVATGAPLLGATIRIVDGTGAALSFVDATGATVSSGSTSTTDGSYRVTLGAAAAKLPLLIQAVGRDAGGTPVVMHTRLVSNAIPVVANITPATEAIVAMVLGANPLTMFQTATANTGSLALLGNSAAVTAAADLVKAIVASNLTDGKVADSKTLDFFQDTSFTPNKTGLDAALEGLRIQVVKDSNGKDQLQFSNKFLSAGTVEVKVDLATAKTELAKTSGGSVAKAIVSTAKTTTSPTSTLANLAALDGLSIAANKLIAQGANADFAALISATGAQPYVHNGYDRTFLTAKLASYASNNYQLNKFQMTGCADDPITSKGCVRVTVSSVVTNVAGQIVDVLSDAVSYNKATTPNWTFVGNNLLSDFHIYPVAYITYGLDGSSANASALSSGSGVQVSIYSPASDPQRPNDRNIEMPNGHTLRFSQCGLDYQCLATAPPPATTTGTGELKDFLLQQASLGWMGSLDTTMGAKYRLNFVEVITNAGVPVNAYLSADVPTDLVNAPYPRLDDVSASRPLTPAAIAKGPTLSWATWAAAYPNLKIFLARTVISSATATPLIQDATIPASAATSAQVPAAVVPADFVPLSYQVWLGAQDSLGRRYYSKYSSAP